MRSSQKWHPRVRGQRPEAARSIGRRNLGSQVTQTQRREGHVETLLLLLSAVAGLGHLHRESHMVGSEMVDSTLWEHERWSILMAQEFLALVNLTQARVTRKQGRLGEGSPSIRLACKQVCGVFSCLMIEAGGPSSLWVSPSLDEWSLGIEEQAEPGVGNKPIRCVSPYLFLHFSL